MVRIDQYNLSRMLGRNLKADGMKHVPNLGFAVKLKKGYSMIS